ncbi:hypothetical protein [Fulvivirga sediminis]|uniref:Uncharacterized protein n=1 Tax=Fulvivirga sediminis TaxID=2803949 RepID=A0A937FBW2_9BACT|nr:hypothetical protein [Fulvivirga sediminis]MBL3657618.1 hypothetical protein [Fulvivirga sediminis]
MYCSIGEAFGQPSLKASNIVLLALLISGANQFIAKISDSPFKNDLKRYELSEMRERYYLRIN